MKEPSKTEMLRAIRELLNIKHKMKKHHISYLCKAKFGKPLAKMEKYQIRELYDFFELGEQKEKEYKNELIKNYEENKERGVLPRAIIKARDNDRCFMCNDPVEGEEGHIHHIKPKTFYGEDTEDNCLLLCVSCHRHWHKSPNLKHKFSIMQSLRTKWKESEYHAAAAELIWNSNHNRYMDSIGIEIEINDTIKKVNDIVENGEATCIWCESFESWCECESFAARSFRPLPLWE
tara:strand:+ start:166 stop:867 length:702 start_codon:yes stop_codon:yes gene_type:complete